jgi:hypothetical protein
VTEFYDSITGQWPQGAQYAALYYDSSVDGDGFKPQRSTIPHQRWITRRGGPDAALHAGIADFELHNLVYSGNNLATWAEARLASQWRARTYCNRWDVSRAWPQVGHLANSYWWIATLDNNPHWTPAGIVASVRAITGITLPVDRVWGVQWGTNPAYDTSTLFGEW